MVALVNRKSPVQVIAQSAVASAHTGSTTETTLATIAVPAGVMGANGRLEIHVMYSMTNNANSKTSRVRFGGQNLHARANSSTDGYAGLVIIANRNSQSSQTSTYAISGGVGTGTIATGTVDTSAAQNLTITGQLGSATDTITLESYQVLVYPAA